MNRRMFPVIAASNALTSSFAYLRNNGAFAVFSADPLIEACNGWISRIFPVTVVEVVS
ncbi:hypothetical protein [Priestia megaterium]|uniref:hypothetical protein n=1 Tax=Priestia megaterium TaxID=1404 RepID=UPI0039F65BE4